MAMDGHSVVLSLVGWMIESGLPTALLSGERHHLSDEETEAWMAGCPPEVTQQEERAGGSQVGLLWSPRLRARVRVCVLACNWQCWDGTQGPAQASPVLHQRAPPPAWRCLSCKGGAMREGGDLTAVPLQTESRAWLSPAPPSAVSDG